ncbi:MAG: hypothetical protein ACR2L1_06880 [Pyrinomonadaceae bacterium]
MERGGRQLLFWAFAVALIVGTVGFWQHNGEHFGQRIAGVFTVWGETAPEDQHSGEKNGGENSAGENQGQGNDSRKHEEALLLPVFAPLTFAGLGILGMLACARRFQRENLSEE